MRGLNVGFFQRGVWSRVSSERYAAVSESMLMATCWARGGDLEHKSARKICIFRLLITRMKICRVLIIGLGSLICGTKSTSERPRLLKNDHRLGFSYILGRNGFSN